MIRMGNSIRHKWVNAVEEQEAVAIVTSKDTTCTKYIEMELGADKTKY